MSRYSHAAVLGLVLVSCQKATVTQRSDSLSTGATNTVESSDDIEHGEKLASSQIKAPCAATNKSGTFTAVGESGSNTLALMRFSNESGTKTLAIAADEDERALQMIDVDTHTSLGTTKLAGKPARVLAMADGRIIVSLGDIGALEILEPSPDTGFPLVRRCLVQTPADPMGLALTRDQKTLLVTSRWEPTLSIFHAVDMTPRHSVDLPRDPTNVLASTDGKRAFVTHAAGGIMSVVELNGNPEKPGEPVSRSVLISTNQFLNQPMAMPMIPPPKVVHSTKTRRPVVKHQRIGSQSFVLARSEKGIFAPLVMVEPKPPRGSSSGYGSASAEAPPVVGEIATINESSGDIEVKQSAVGTGPKDCFLPRAAVVDETQREIFVSCLGIDSIIVYDGSKKNPHDHEKRRITVPAGPTGLALDSNGRRLVVFSSFAGEVTFVPLESLTAKTEVLSTRRMAKRNKKSKQSSKKSDFVHVVLPGRTGLSAELALGRGLFHSVGRRKIALDGRACASCHPDGRDDGLTWQTQEGPRQTPMLIGRISQDTAPFGWLGDKKTLPSHFKRTIERLAGTGLKESERDAIFAYVNSLSPPKSGKTTDDPRITQGKTIFESSATGCSSCHLGDATTDGDRHDVKSAGEFEAEHKFETPSLRFIARSAPYFHDGRYATLMDMIQHCDGEMGTTKHLGDTDKASLAAYLQTL